jgi:hypothetical protein
MRLDAMASRHARRQYGLLTRAQALALGYSPKQIRTKLELGTWVEIRRGVYIVGGVPPSWEQALCAVVLPFDDAWIGIGTAARHLDLPNAPTVEGIEVVRPYGKHRRVDGVVEHRSRIITPADVTRHKGIAVTSAGRTIIDCSGRLTVAQTGKMIDHAMRKHRLALEDTRACFARLSGGGRRRMQSAAGALAARIPGYDPGESDLEINTLRTIVAAGLPMPVQQHRIVLNGKRCRIDLSYPPEKVAMELQSWDWHGGRESFDDDKARMSDLTAIGWRGIEITSRHSAADIVRWVSGALEHAAA